MRDKLKPCPFCGGEARIVTHLSEDRSTIECRGCGMKLRWFSSGEEAMESWNKRPNSWHTGTPTEEGYYLVHLDGYYNKDTVGYIVAIWKNEGWRNINKGSCYNLGGVEAWQKIEPFEEETE